MVPTCMMIYWKLESPSGVAELYERKKDYNLVQNQENIFQENKEFLLSLKESEWRTKKHWKKEQLQRRRWYGLKQNDLEFPKFRCM